MAAEWRNVSLGTLLKGGIRHGLYKPLEAFGIGSRVLKMGLQFSADRIGIQEMPRVPLSDEEISRFRVYEGDLLFSRTSMMNDGAGKCSLVVAHDEPFVFDGNIMCGTPDKSLVDPSYVFYFFKSPSGKQSISEIIAGTQSRSLSGTSLSKVLVRVPPLHQQYSIAHILGSLDEKIELNRRMSETLEAMARALFKSWFVDFDPVRAKAEGRDTGLPREIADLFPDRFVDSEWGEIPEGWHVKSIEEVAERVAMGPFGASIKVETFVPDGVPIISGQHLRGFALEDNSFNFITTAHANRLANANVQRGDVVFTHAGNVGQVAFIPEVSRYERYVISQRQFYMRCDRSQISPTFIAFYFGSAEGRHRLLANTSSSGVPSIARPVTYLRTIPLIIPAFPVLASFECHVAPILGMYLKNLQTNVTLTTIRDSLLPKLISGKIRVKDVQSLVASD